MMPLKERRWRCSVDGNFLVYLILLLILTAVQAAIMIVIYHTDLDAFREKVMQWDGCYTDDFYVMYVAIMIINVLNFFMSMFAVYMLVKMSRAKWSIKNNNSREA